MEPHDSDSAAVVYNPYPIPPGVLRRAFATSGPALLTTCAIAGVGSAAGLVLSIASNGHPLFLAIMVLGAVVCGASAVARSRVESRRSAAVDQVEAHRQQFGPDSVRLSAIMDRSLARIAGDAHSAVRTITESPAVTAGGLGDQESVVAKAQLLEWEVLTDACSLDRAYVERDLVRSRVQATRGAAAALANEDEQLRAALHSGHARLRAQADVLQRLAAQVVELDARRAVPAAEEALRRLMPPEPEAALPLATDLAARIAAANDVLDHGGYTPRSLP